jgi:hypothetical protein
VGRKLSRLDPGRRAPQAGDRAPGPPQCHDDRGASVWGAALAATLRELQAERETIIAAGEDRDLPRRP